MRTPQFNVRRGFLLALGGCFLAFGLAFAGATQFENQDANCASCHTQPEVEFVTRAQSVSAGAAATDLASSHAGIGTGPTRCIDCHSGPAPLGRLGSIALGAKNVYVHVSSPGVRYPAAPHNDENCVKCHVDLEKSTNFDLHSHRYLPEWWAKAPESAARCATCHTSHSVDGVPAIGFLNQARTQQQCEACHAVLIPRR
jgi:hypothetical protein